MKKALSLIAISLLLTFSAKTSAQILTLDAQAREITEYNIYTSDNLSEDHSAKIVRYNEKYSVVLNTLDSNSQATFGLLEKGTINTLKTVYMPIGYKINDFTILNDTLYFVGCKFDETTTTKGVIGYVSVMDLFTNPNQSCTYAEIRSTYNLFRVETYDDNKGETVVASTGRQFYGEVYYQEEPDFDLDEPLVPGPELPLPPNANIVEPQITGDNQQQSISYDELGLGWRTDTLKHRECLATLHIRRTSDSISHKYDLWHLPFENFQGRIRDLCLTKDFISVVTTYFDTGYCPLKNRFNIYWFDKNNLENRWSKRLIGQLHSFSDSTIRGELETVCLRENDIAMCYMGNVGENCNVLYKLRIDTNTITPLLSHIFALSGDSIKHHVWDLEYVQEENMLIVLKRSNIFQRVDEVWHLSMNDNTSMPYESYVHTKYYENLSSLELYNNIYLGVYGNIPSRKILFEKQCNEFNSFGNCYDIRKEKVHSELLPSVGENPLMKRCEFIYMSNLIQYVLALPEYQSVQYFRAKHINQDNIINPCNNVNADIIYN